MATLRMIPDEQWQSLRNHGQFISGMELVTRLDAALVEVDIGDLVEMLHAWRWEQEHGTRELRPFSEYILGHIKEGK